MALKKIIGWFNFPFVVNYNFEQLEEEIEAINTEIEAIEGSAVQEAAAVANISGTNLPAVPGAFADTAAVKTYMDSLVPASETRFDLIDSKINDLLTKLRASGAIAE